MIERYILEVCPKHKGCYSETLRLQSLARHALGKRFVASLQPLDFARYRDDGLKIRMRATVQRERSLFSAVLEVGRKEWGSDGKIRRIYEALYLKALVPDEDLMPPNPQNQTPNTRALFEFLFSPALKIPLPRMR